jgi:hypothetical protein
VLAGVAGMDEFEIGVWFELVGGDWCGGVLGDRHYVVNVSC